MNQSETGPMSAILSVTRGDHYYSGGCLFSYEAISNTVLNSKSYLFKICDISLITSPATSTEQTEKSGMISSVDTWVIIIIFYFSDF